MSAKCSRIRIEVAVQLEEGMKLLAGGDLQGFRNLEGLFGADRGGLAETID